MYRRNEEMLHSRGWMMMQDAMVGLYMYMYSESVFCTCVYVHESTPSTKCGTVEE
jgi:hypothetical protein